MRPASERASWAGESPRGRDKLLHRLHFRHPLRTAVIPCNPLRSVVIRCRAGWFTLNHRAWFKAEDLVNAGSDLVEPGGHGVLWFTPDAGTFRLGGSPSLARNRLARKAQLSGRLSGPPGRNPV